MNYMAEILDSPRRNKWTGVVLVLAALFAAEVFVAGVPPAGAQANVTIAPTRVVFEDRQRSEELVLLNRGNEPVTYRISMIGMHMNEQGRLERVEEPVDGQRFAHDILRFAPRQVRLDPGVSQRVRLMVRKPADLPEGEYRSHMLFQAVPDSPPESDDDVDDDQLALRLNIISGLSIATIVRHGDLSVDLSVKDMELVRTEDDEQPDQFRFRLERSGDRSVYGDIAVEFVPDESDDEERPEPVRIGQRPGTAVYTPNEERAFEIALNPPDELELENGRIVVTYREDGDDEPLVTDELHLE